MVVGEEVLPALVPCCLASSQHLPLLLLLPSLNAFDDSISLGLMSHGHFMEKKNLLCCQIQLCLWATGKINITGKFVVLDCVHF